MAKKAIAKETKKINFASQNKKPLLVLVATLFIAIGVAAALQVQARPAYVKVCYSEDSTSTQPIEARITSTVKWWDSLDIGECGSVKNSSTEARVWIPYMNDEGKPDSNLNLKSYQVKKDGGSYGPCHAAGVTSNPPDVAKAYYKTYKKADCAG
jgi:hypothetical protein